MVGLGTKCALFSNLNQSGGVGVGVLVPQTKCPLCLAPPPHYKGCQLCPTMVAMGNVVAFQSIAPTCTFKF